MLKFLHDYFYPKPRLDPNQSEFTDAEMESVQNFYMKRYGLIFLVSKWLRFESKLGPNWRLAFLEPLKGLRDVCEAVANLAVALVRFVALFLMVVGLLLWLPARFLFRAVFSGIIIPGEADTKILAEFVQSKWLPRKREEKKEEARVIREANQWYLHFEVEENSVTRNFYTTAFDAPTQRSAKIEAEQRFKNWWNVNTALELPEYKVRVDNEKRDITITTPSQRMLIKSGK